MLPVTRMGCTTSPPEFPGNVSRSGPKYTVSTPENVKEPARFASIDPANVAAVHAKTKRTVFADETTEMALPPHWALLSGSEDEQLEITAAVVSSERAQRILDCVMPPVCLALPSLKTAH